MTNILTLTLTICAWSMAWAADSFVQTWTLHEQSEKNNNIHINHNCYHRQTFYLKKKIAYRYIFYNWFQNMFPASTNSFNVLCYTSSWRFSDCKYDFQFIQLFKIKLA